MVYRLEIHDSNDILSVKLSDLLSSIHLVNDYKWKILWLNAVGNNVLEFENKINSSKDGYSTNINELFKIDKDLNQINEILIIGDKNSLILKKYEWDEDMYNSCAVCIELVDSSYWQINSSDELFVNDLIKKFPRQSKR